MCGAASTSRSAQVVPDVHSFPSHIACASSTQSEIVVPVIQTSTNVLLGVLDVDSNYKAAFTEADREGLEEICRWFGEQEWCNGLVDATGVTLD